MPSRCRNLALHVLCFCLCGQMASARTIGFAGPAAPLYTLVKSAASVDAKAGMLQIDTMASRQVWNPCFLTRDDLFQPNTQYDIAFPYHVEQAGEDSYLLLLMRPLAATNQLQDAAFMEVYAAPADGIVHFYVTIPQEGPRYAFQIHTCRNLRAQVGAIEIRELVREFLPADRDTAAVTEPGDLPTGSEDFTVDLPRLEKAKTYQGTDLGISPDNPDNTAALQGAIAKLRKLGPSRLVLGPGVYRFTSDTAITLPSTRDFELDGQGAQFVFRKNKDKLFRVEHCERVALRNFSIDWDWEQDPLASIVKVEAKAAAGDAIDLRFVDYTAFPRQDVRVADLVKVDAATRDALAVGGWGLQFEFYKGQAVPKTEWLEPNLLRLHAAPGKLALAVVGDVLRMRHCVYDMTAINLINNRHLTIDNVQVLSCPGMGIVTSGIQEYWQIINSSVSPPPGSRRVIGSTADCIHVVSSRGHFRLENTVLGTSGDDTLNIHDNNAFAVRTDDHRLTSQNIRFHPGNYYQAGDLIELRHDDFSPTGFTAKVLEVKPVDRGRGRYEFTFAETLPEQAGSGFVLFDRRYGTENVIVRGCTFHDFPRGILLMANNVTIENNEFTQGKASAIKIETGYTMKVWSEGYGAANVVIRGNHFASVNRTGRYTFENRPDIYLSSYQVTDPSMAKTDYPILNRILIQNNRFEGTTGAPIFMASTGRVTITGNTFDLQGQPAVATDYRGGIGVVHSSGVAILGNTWKNANGSCKPGVLYEPSSVTGLVSSGNRIAP